MKWGGYGLRLVPLAFLGVFFLYPLFSIFNLSIRPDGIWDLSGFTKIVLSAYYRNTFLFTLWQALLSTVLTVGLAIPASYCFTRYQFPGKRILLSLSTVPFVLPTVVVAVAFSSLIGPNGLVNGVLITVFDLERAPIRLENTLSIIIIVHVFYNYSVALRMITGYWVNHSQRIEEAARLLGAHGWRLWWYIRLPILRPAILASSILIFMFTFTSFGVVLILGGIRFATIEVQIYYQVIHVFNLPIAAALSLLQIMMMFALMLFYTSTQRQISTVDLQNARHTARPVRTFPQRVFLIVNLSVLVILLCTPLIALVYRSLVQAGMFNLEAYSGLTSNPKNSILFVAPIVAIKNSIQFAFLTTVFSVMLGLLSVYLIERRASRSSKWIDSLSMLPLATSAVTLGFGMLIALDTPPLDLRSSWWIIPIAHTLVAVPFVIRSVLPALRKIPTQMPEAALVLGAAPHRVWFYIEVPMLLRSILVGATFAFTVSMGEFGASMFVARPDTPTMPIVIYRLLGQPGITHYEQALAMSTILMLVSAISFMAIERIRIHGMSEF